MKARLVQLVVAVLVVTLGGVARGASPDFDRIVAPLLSERCLACHGGNKPKGGLDLSRRRSAMDGGDQGAAIVPGKPDASVLWEYVNDGKMPPKKPLRAAEKEVLRAWIAAGAGWGSDPIDPFRASTDKRAGYDWWALQPVVRRKPPTQQSEAMKRVVRQDELEDLVSTVGQTFLGLTIHCARCHDHKFDPIRQVEYYRLTSALGGVRHGERVLPSQLSRPGGKVYAVAEAILRNVERRRVTSRG